MQSSEGGRHSLSPGPEVFSVTQGNKFWKLPSARPSGRGRFQVVELGQTDRILVKCFKSLLWGFVIRQCL